MPSTKNDRYGRAQPVLEGFLIKLIIDRIMINTVCIPPLLKLSKRWTLRAPTWDVPVISVEIWREQKILQTGVDVRDDGEGKKQKKYFCITRAITSRVGGINTSVPRTKNG